MKTCSKCGEDKPLDAFYRQTNRPDGLKSACKSCSVYRKSPQALERQRSRKRADYAARRDEVNARQRELYAENAEHRREQARRYRLADGVDAARERDRARYAANAEKKRAQAAVRRRRDREKIREQARSRNYNVPPGWYGKQLARQGGRCAICKSEDPRGTGTSFHVDHDHSCCPEAGRSCGSCIRGLLCSDCNTSLGKFRDDIAILRAAIDYLTKGGPRD